MPKFYKVGINDCVALKNCILQIRGNSLIIVNIDKKIPAKIFIPDILIIPNDKYKIDCITDAKSLEIKCTGLGPKLSRELKVRRLKGDKNRHRFLLDDTKDIEKIGVRLYLASDYNKTVINDFKIKVVNTGRNLIKVTKAEPIYKHRIFYIVNTSIPLTTNGYTVRSHEILKALVKNGIDVYCINRPIFNPSKEYEEIDGVKYIITRLNSDITVQVDSIYNRIYIEKFYEVLKELYIKYHPNIIHTCSNYVNPLAGHLLAEEFKLPLIYEVRGLWHLSKLSYDPSWKDTENFNSYIKLENRAYELADKIVTITDNLKKELMDYGVDGDKMEVMPNCADIDRYRFSKKDKLIIQKYGLGGYTVFGYVGSVVNYEGLDLLIRATRTLMDNGKKFKVLIVGKGETKSCIQTFEDLKDLTIRIGLDRHVHFTGHISNQEIEKYYSVIDVVCLPRKGFKVCEIVAPLKPFEAMSMSKPLIVSNVEPLKKIVIYGSTGLVHKKGDYNDLAKKMNNFLNNPSSIREFGRNARDWVDENRRWDKECGRLVRIYDELNPHKKSCG